MHDSLSSLKSCRVHEQSMYTLSFIASTDVIDPFYNISLTQDG